MRARVAPAQVVADLDDLRKFTTELYSLSRSVK